MVTPEDLELQLAERYRSHSCGQYGDLSLTPERAAGIAAAVFGPELERLGQQLATARTALKRVRGQAESWKDTPDGSDVAEDLLAVLDTTVAITIPDKVLRDGGESA